MGGRRCGYSLPERSDVPAGMSFCVLSEKAENACATIESRDFYIDFKSIKKSIEKNGQTPGSTPVSLVLAVHEAVKMIHEEGVENVLPATMT